VEGLHIVVGHLLKDKYQIFVLCMMCILKSSYNIIRIVFIYCMYVLMLFMHE
jgi:hypothetical protein